MEAPGVKGADDGILEPAGGVGSLGAIEVCVSIGCRFCIFSIRETLKASNRLRNMDEYVLNFKH